MLNAFPEQFILKPAFAKIVCEPSWKWLPREKPLENFDLFYVWDGEGEVILNGKAYEVSKGSCFLFQPGDYTSATHHPQKPLVLTYIHFAVEPMPTSIPKSYRQLKETIDFETLLSRYVRLFLLETFAEKIEAQLILKQLMIQLLRHDKSVKIEETKHSKELIERIHEVASYIRLHPGLPHRVEDLAQRAQLSPRYFAATFKRMIGLSIRSYVVQARIRRAEHLLSYAGMSVSEVAEALGYNDVFFFSRQFKQYTGKNPSSLR